MVRLSVNADLHTLMIKLQIVLFSNLAHLNDIELRKFFSQYIYQNKKNFFKIRFGVMSHIDIDVSQNICISFSHLMYITKLDMYIHVLFFCLEGAMNTREYLVSKRKILLSAMLSN